MPAVVGENGVEKNVKVSLNAEEETAVKKSAEMLKDIISELDLDY